MGLYVEPDIEGRLMISCDDYWHLMEVLGSNGIIGFSSLLYAGLGCS